MKRMFAAAAASALSCLLGATASAATLHYDEAVDGDLIHEGLVTELGLDIGHNTVKGQMHTIVHLELPNAPWDLDFDPMNLLLPAGQQITAMRVDFSFKDTTQNTLKVEWNWRVMAWPSFTWNDNCFVISGTEPYCSAPIYSPTGGDLLGGLSPTEKRYLITLGNGMLWNDFQKPVGGTLDYTVSIDVAPVPEPGTWLLSLAGLSLLGWLGRARRAARA